LSIVAEDGEQFGSDRLDEQHCLAQFGPAGVQVVERAVAELERPLETFCRHRHSTRDTRAGAG
jgi:hypothetical protein